MQSLKTLNRLHRLNSFHRFRFYNNRHLKLRRRRLFSFFCFSALSAAIAGHLAQSSSAVLQATGSDCRECPVRGASGLLDFVCRVMCGQAVFLLPDLPNTPLAEVYSMYIQIYIYIYVVVIVAATEAASITRTPYI